MCTSKKAWFSLKTKKVNFIITGSSILEIRLGVLGFFSGEVADFDKDPRKSADLVIEKHDCILKYRYFG